MIFLHLLLLGVGLAGDGFAARADDAEGESFSRDQLDFFEARVRPLLVQHCFECHSAQAGKLKGMLRLDSRDFALRGGESGAAIVPGKPDESLLVAAVRWKSLEMPPQGKLKDSDVETLSKWVEMGVPWPADEAPQSLPTSPGDYDWAKWRREHWSFQPVIKPIPPPVPNEAWIQTPVDRFVSPRLDQAGLVPAVPADARILVRRIYFDLIGLPPSPEQSEAFVAAAQQDRAAALRTLVDDLLASPHYGERWGRHWLDVARYSDGFGGFLDNAEYGDAWRYRDWVIGALNQDLPFDEFIRAQIAGDLMGDQRLAVATGYFALGPHYNSDGGDPDSVAQARAETLSDRLDTLGQGMLGLTIACARCHDHKFDPLPQEDYYSLAGIFNNSATQEVALAPEPVVQAFHKQQQAIADLKQVIKALQDQINARQGETTDAEKRQLEERQTQLAELERSAIPKYETAHALADTGAADMTLAIRGNLRNAGPPVPRRFPRILAGDVRPAYHVGSGRRELADAVADPANPLTARVFVNRVWMHHFGQALVRTPNNFGSLGESPTHPQLLDWLAATLLESRSIKELHRVMLLSSAYQMSSDFNEQAFSQDGDNRLLWRMNPRRLDAEAWRDALLSVTGELDVSLGGPATDSVDSRRRTVYFKVSRNGDVFATDEFLRLFDFPLMRASVARRPTSIVPQQFLFLINSPFMAQRANALAVRLGTEAPTDELRIERAYRLLYQRPANPVDLEIGLAFLRAARPDRERRSAWEEYTQILLGSNEFMYLR